MTFKLDESEKLDVLFAGRYIERVFMHDEALKLSGKTIDALNARCEFEDLSIRKVSVRYLYDAMIKNGRDDISIKMFSERALKTLAETVDKDFTTEERIRVSKARSAFVRKHKNRIECTNVKRVIDVSRGTALELQHVTKMINQRVGNEHRLTKIQVAEHAVCEMAKYIAQIDDNKLKQLCEEISKREDWHFTYLNHD